MSKWNLKINRPFFRTTKINFGWQLGLILILLFGIPRFILVLQANQSGNYNLISVLFICMWIAPFLLLKKEGRKSIGIVKPKQFLWLLYSLLLGVGFAIIVYGIGTALYSTTFKNWFVYISNSYPLPTDNWDELKTTYFVIFVVIGMTFSPIGEELLYRGMVHQCFAKNMSDTKASHLDSLAFAVTHLAHFGIVWMNEEWKFLVVPATLWVILIYLSGRLFFICKEQSGSISGAIICHAGFNLSMTAIIFYWIL